MKGSVAGGSALAGAALGALLMWMLMPASKPAAEDAEAAQTAETASAGELTLNARELAAAGIRTEPLAAARAGGMRSGYARAVDLSPLAALAADAETARAAVAASQKEVTRLTILTRQDQSAAPKNLDAARAQLASDQARLTLACQKVGLDFGPGLARLGCGAASTLVRNAAQGRAALMRIDMTKGLPPARGAIMIGDGGDAVSARILGPAVNADAQLQTPGVLALVEGPSASRLAVGRVLPVRIADGSGTGGVLVPRSALLRAAGGQFVYRAQGKGRFTRVELSDGAPMEGGWFFAASPLKPGDPVVVAGATTLLGLERGPQAGGH